MNISNPANNKTRYFLAPAWTRLFARVLDLVFLFLILFLLLFVVFAIGNNDFLHDKEFFDNTPAWKYFIFSLFSCGLIFGYFVCLPLIWNGKTIGCWICKICVVNTHIFDTKFIGLIKREIFLSESFAVISLILGITLVSLGDTNATLLLKAMVQGEHNAFSDATVVFEALYYVSGIMLFVCILWMFVRNKKRCLQDIVSDTVTIKLNTQSDTTNNKTNAKIKASTKNYKLPGEVESIDLGEISEE